MNRPPLPVAQLDPRATTSATRSLGRVAVGCSVWFRNRQVGLRDRWFWLRTIPDYRGAPPD
jgi:hypothetical protein